MSAANQVRVSQAGPSARHSFQVITPAMRSVERPTSAAATEPTPIEAPKIQSPTVTTSAAAMIFSSELIGPSLASSSLALTGASGESFTSGG
eukprot:31198-Pelagococcus_subviridis.AAC.66